MSKQVPAERSEARDGLAKVQREIDELEGKR